MSKHPVSFCIFLMPPKLDSYLIFHGCCHLPFHCVKNWNKTVLDLGPRRVFLQLRFRTQTISYMKLNSVPVTLTYEIMFLKAKRRNFERRFLINVLKIPLGCLHVRCRTQCVFVSNGKWYCGSSGSDQAFLSPRNRRWVSRIVYRKNAFNILSRVVKSTFVKPFQNLRLMFQWD